MRLLDINSDIGNKKRSIDQVETKSDPFDQLKTSNDQVLKDIQSRSPCPTCKKTVKYFCYKCYQIVGMDRSDIPSVELPVHLDV